MVRLKKVQEPEDRRWSDAIPNQQEKEPPPLITVGVLTTANKRGLPGGERISLLKEMVNYGNSKNITIFFFFPRDVDWKKRRIIGYTWNGISWRRKLFPFPRIIYNRIRFRNIESQNHVKNLLKKFERDTSIYLFNSRFLNKWEVYKALKNRISTANWQPETIPFNRHSLILMTKKYQEIFLKYSHGSLGKGIIKVKRLPNGKYAYAIAQKGAMNWKKLNSLDALYRHLAYQAKHAYLIQHGIELARYKGHIFDLRSQYQKNGIGQWVLTGIGVRVAGRNRFVTHIPNGGHAASFNTVINEVFGTDSDTRKYIEKQLDEIRDLVPKVLEHELKLSLAVLSMDIGIDKNGRVWIIEINSKPAYFNENDIRYTHWQNLMNYFIYLCKKPS